MPSNSPASFPRISWWTAAGSTKARRSSASGLVPTGAPHPFASAHRTSLWWSSRWRTQVGHKVNPYGFRLGVIYPWKSNWYAKKDYAEQLHEDVRIRKHIRRKLSRAGISSIDIERKGDQV